MNRFGQFALPTICYSFFFSSIFISQAVAQRSGANAQGPPRPTTQQPTSKLDQTEIILRNADSQPEAKKGEEGACFLPPLVGAHSATVGVATLEVQGKAKKEYDKSCSSLQSQKFEEAEKRLHEAVEKYPDYSTLWILLAQVLERRQAFQPARDACLQAVKVNPIFVPAYLCLADISAHSEDWKDVLVQSAHAIQLDATTNPISYLYSATARFNLHQVDDAEKDVLRGIAISREHPNPRLHYLLAQIYEVKGDRTDEIAQYRIFLKLAEGTPAAETVKQYLAKLQRENADDQGKVSEQRK